jgi:hypothetical protein
MKKETPLPNQIAYYFGLTVEVVHILEHCSLIRFDDQEFIVETADLLTIDHTKRAA